MLIVVLWEVLLHEDVSA
jgi:hypothetical protein